MNIIPGEPVPPGFEDEVNRVAEIQSKIENNKDDILIGVEYTVEILNDDDREPSYLCLLCDKRGDPRTIVNHWISYNHRLKYLEKHFPSAMRELAPLRYKPDSRLNMTKMVVDLCKAIENHYGRLTVCVFHCDDFRNRRERITEEINNKYHFDEKTGPAFLNIVNRDIVLNKKTHTLQITIKTPERINAIVNPSPPEEKDDFDAISSDEDTQQNKGGPSSAKKKRRSQSPAYKVLPRVRRSPPFEESRSRDPKKVTNTASTLPSPKELSMQAFQIAQERYKWEKYRCMLEIAIKNLEKSLKDYEKNPEKHPLYPEEWKKFWNRRYKELQNEKKVDPNKYDYKPEWIIFWTKRMKELHADEIEEKKKQIKLNLGLKEDAEEKTDILKQKYKIQPATDRNIPKPTKNANEPSSNNHPSINSRKDLPPQKPLTVINISDDEDDERRSSSKSKSKRVRHRSRSRSLSPLSDDYREPERRRTSYRSALYERSRPSRPTHYSSRAPVAEYYPSYHGSHFPPPPTYGSGYRVMDPYMYPKYDKEESFPQLKGKSNMKEEIEEPEDDGPLTVVAVLRLLTALEEHLGSLGPKVVDLLGKALALEKVKANSADEMLVNEDNSVFFETIKEKLKGLLIADVLEDSQKVRAVKKAVKNIAAIIHQVNAKGPSTNKVATEKPDIKNSEEKLSAAKKSTKPTIADLPFDRQIVSTKLAAALVMQGREDVSTGDMDKLIYFFVLMVKLSKEKVQSDGKPIEMKHVLSELGIAPEISPELVEELIENEVSALAAEVEMEIEDSEKDLNASSSASALESLTDSDLQTLLQNFKHLSTEEQHHLIAHLKKLETADPIRVEKLRKYVNLESDGKETSNSAGTNSDYRQSESSKSKRSAGEESPRSLRRDQYTDDEASRSSNVRRFIDDDDEDDDYNFEDVFKAVSSSVSRNSEERSQQSSSNKRPDPPQPSDNIKIQQHSNLRQIPLQISPPIPASKPTDKSNIGVSLDETHNIIANLMGSLQQSCGQFNNSKGDKSSDNRGPNPPKSGDHLSGRNPSQPNSSSSSVPFYQQQQQQQQTQQNMYPNFQAAQNPQAPGQNFYPGNFNNTIAYPSYNYGGQGPPNMNGQQLAPFNMNYMNQQVPDPSNYMFGGNSGYK